MFEGWENYYLMIGSSAGALIGLMFVVVTLTAGRDHDQVERGKHLYTSPIVWHLGVIVVMSGTAAVPTITPRLFAAMAGGLALLGVGWGVRSAVGIARARLTKDNMFDMFWYGIAPALVYFGLAGAAVAILCGRQWGTTAVAADLMILLLVSIHAEWDLVTFLAPGAGRSDTDKQR
jgi:hypothetical protein